MEKTRNMPDVQTAGTVRVAELKLVQDVPPVKAPERKAEPQARFIEDVEDMWDNLPI